MTRLTAHDLIVSVQQAIDLTAAFAAPLDRSSPLRRVYDQFVAAASATADPVKPLKAAVHELHFLQKNIETLQTEQPDHPDVKAYNTFRGAIAPFKALAI